MFVELIELFHCPGCWSVMEDHKHIGMVYGPDPRWTAKCFPKLATYLSECKELGMTIMKKTDKHGWTNYVIRG